MLLRRCKVIFVNFETNDGMSILLTFGSREIVSISVEGTTSQLLRSIVKPIHNEPFDISKIVQFDSLTPFEIEDVLKDLQNLYTSPTICSSIQSISTFYILNFLLDDRKAQFAYTKILPRQKFFVFEIFYGSPWLPSIYDILWEMYEYDYILELWEFARYLTKSTKYFLLYGKMSPRVDDHFEDPYFRGPDYILLRISRDSNLFLPIARNIKTDYYWIQERVDIAAIADLSLALFPRHQFSLHVNGKKYVLYTGNKKWTMKRKKSNSLEKLISVQEYMTNFGNWFKIESLS